VNIVILVMAAGYSSRFRQSGQGNKLAAIMQGKPLLQHTLDNVRATGFDFYVVARPEDLELKDFMAQERIVTCSSEGLGESIAAGVSATAGYDGWLITLADMPFITPSSYQHIAHALRTSPLVRARIKGIQGHPVGFQQSFYPQLCALKGDKGARELLKADALTQVDLADRGCITDIDTAEDLTRCNQDLRFLSR